MIRVKPSPTTPLSDVTAIRVKPEGSNSLQNVTIIKAFFKGKWYTIWELIVAYLFTSDGYGIKTQDDYIVKCSDQ